MEFPREVMRVGECLAVVISKPGRLGEPNTRTRAAVMFEGEKWGPSRLSYHLNVEEIPRLCVSRKEGFVLHECDNGWCVEPGHLYLGTAKQNSQDAFERHPTLRSNHFGRIRSQETRDRIGAKSRMKVMSPEAREKIRQANLGRKHSQETKDKIRAGVKVRNAEAVNGS